MTNTNIRQYADELSDILMRIEDAKVEAAAIVDAAKEAGIDTKALKKVAKEMTMQSDKLQAKYEAEEQLELFREATKIRQRKGLSTIDAARTQTEANIAFLEGLRAIREAAR